MRTSLTLCVTALLTGIGFAQTTARVNVTSIGTQANNNSQSGGLSRDGRWVVFTSSGAALVPNDGNGVDDAFVHDRITGVTTRLSVSTTGGDANQATTVIAVAEDATVAIFHSRASNLVAVDTTGINPDVFVRDWVLGTTELVSLRQDGTQAQIAGWASLALSADGRFALFSSADANVVPGDTNGDDDVYVRDRLLGTTVLVSATPAGVPGNGKSLAVHPSMSDDGRFVVFDSLASDLVLGDTVNGYDVFLRDLQLGTTVRFDTDANGIPAAHMYGARGASISGDGTTGFFYSSDPNLVANDSGTTTDLFAKDIATGAIERVNLTTAGDAVPAYFAYGYEPSTDGRRLAIAMSGGGLVAGFDTGIHVFLRDRDTGTAELIDAGWDGSAPDAQCWVSHASLSGDGRVAAFTSRASNLVVGDTNGIPFAATTDAFVRDFDVATPPTAYCTAKLNSQGCTPVIGSSGIPSVAEYDSFRVTAHSVLNQKLGLAFWSTLPTGTPYFGGTLCCKPPVKRTTLQNSAGNASGTDCSGFYSFAFSQSYLASQSLGAGATVYAQYWSRDPGYAPPNNMGLTSGVKFVVAP